MNNRKVSFNIVVALVLFATNLCAQSATDVLQFGNKNSEQDHQLKADQSEMINGALSQTARVLLPSKPISFEGGKLAFKMKVDAEKQNYLTIKFWGSDRDRSMLMLFSQGKQVGYRHLGDIDLLWLGNGEPPLNDHFFYVTLPIPLKDTQGKTETDLELRSYGEIWGYGENFAKYQKNFTEKSLGLYRAYTHTDTHLQLPKDEKQALNSVSQQLKVRTSPGIEVLDALKKRVNVELLSVLNLKRPLNQLEMMFLASAYHTNWSLAYQNNDVVEKITNGIDEHYRKYLKDSTIIYNDNSIYNPSWLVTGPIARAIRELWPVLNPQLEQTFDDGKGNQVTHRTAWSKLLKEAITYSSTHRRQYTNQSMIIDLFLNDCNEALLLVNPKSALPREKTIDYLYQSVGLKPWLGRETPTGPERNLGDNYWQLTAKGLTKELGFVGYYGEVLDWVVDIYKSTSLTGKPNTGDEKIKQQLIKMMMARSYFRYPAQDRDGYRAMRAEAVVGWRDASHYPGDVLYGDRGIGWDATPLMTAAATLDPKAIGIAQQMLNDNQFFNMVTDKLKLKGLRVTKSLLTIPDEYQLIVAQQKQQFGLPMSANMPDFVFSDEEDGVVAIKNGGDKLYASLYWRARNAVNHLAKVHYITPTADYIANVYIHAEFEPSGLIYKRPNWVNLAFSGGREWYSGITSAHTGEELPIAKIPDGIKFKVGDENVYAGKASFYRMVYGKYLIAMNTTTTKDFDLVVPKNFLNSVDLVSKKNIGDKEKITVKPGTTVVLFVK